MKNFKISFQLILLIIAIFSCRSGGDQEAVENIYENCCGTAPIELDFDPGKVYVPNIFTPNGDGINDIFYVHSDGGIEMIEEFRITDAEGNKVYEAFSIFPSNVAFSWLPYENSNITHKGVFNYYVKVRNLEGDVFEFNGSVCSFVCDELNPFDNFDNCGFAVQHSGVGTFDQFLPNMEEDCE